MQTYLHGRDLIGDLDFSKEEVETILDVAWDLKRKRALGLDFGPRPRLLARQSAGHALFLLEHAYARLV
jgi:ornithine carbamoyltransferase